MAAFGVGRLSWEDGNGGAIVEDNLKRPLEAVVAEFGALRAEIGYRSTTQHLLMNLNIVTTGAVVGFAVQDGRNAILLLLVPLVSSALGLLYADHARSIALLGGYIHGGMRYLRDGKELPLFLWEAYSGKQVDEEPFYVKYKIAVALVFVVPPALALSYLWIAQRLTATIHWLTWSVALILSTYMIVVVFRTAFKPATDDVVVDTMTTTED